MNAPLVDIIIPCFNMSAYLPQAIDSALAQTYRPIRVIVVDDGSQEDIRSIVRSYEGLVEYIRQENQGQAAARNRGLRESVGEYVVFLDADDLILPSKLAEQVGYLDRRSDVDVVYGKSLLFDCDEAFLPYAEFRPLVAWPDYLDPLTVICPFPIHSATIRRRLIEQAGYFQEELRGDCEDWALWFRCAAQGAKFSFVPTTVALYRQHGRSMSSSERRIAEREAKVVRLFMSVFRDQGGMTDARKKVLACGLLLAASRLLQCRMFSEHTSLMQSAAEYGVFEGKLRCEKFLQHSSPSLNYLFLALDLCDAALPHLAAVALIRAGDLRLVRRDAELHGLAAEFDEIIRQMEVFASDPVGSGYVQCVPLQEDSSETRDLLWLERHIPDTVSHLSYVVFQIGLLSGERGGCEMAVNKFRQAIGMNPYYRLFYEELVRSLDRSGRYAEAEQVVGELLSIDRDSHFPLYHHGKMSLKYRRIGEGLRSLRKAWSIDRISMMRYVLNDVDPLILKYCGPTVWRWRKMMGKSVLSS